MTKEEPFHPRKCPGIEWETKEVPRDPGLEDQPPLLQHRCRNCGWVRYELKAADNSTPPPDTPDTQEQEPVKKRNKNPQHILRNYRTVTDREGNPLNSDAVYWCGKTVPAIIGQSQEGKTVFNTLLITLDKPDHECKRCVERRERDRNCAKEQA